MYGKVLGIVRIQNVGAVKEVRSGKVVEGKVAVGVSKLGIDVRLSANVSVIRCQ